MQEVISLAPDPSLSTTPVTLDRITSTTAARHPREMILCNTCISACTDLQTSNCKPSPDGGPPFLKTPEGHCLTLTYEADDEDRVVKEIVAMGCSNDRPPLTVSFLLCLCVQYSSACLHTSDLRRLLLLIADGVQSAMWVSIYSV